jgi:cellulose 1,4-beta-cellobiosidase
MFSRTVLLSVLAAGASAQQVGTLTTETHPSMPMQSCSAAGSCTTIQTTVTMDANWRWLHTTSGSENCYTGNEWDTTLCPDGATCASKCALDGADYSGTYGVTASGGDLTLKFVTKGSYSTNIGSRMVRLNYSLLNSIFDCICTNGFGSISWLQSQSTRCSSS